MQTDVGELGIPGVAELEKAGVRELALDELTQPYMPPADHGAVHHARKGRDC